MILTTENESRWTIPPALTDMDPWRYVFGWRWGSGPRALVVGINPSFGTSIEPDQTQKTIRRVLAWNGFGEFLLGNPFARRALKPKAILEGDALSHVGPDNREYLAEMMDFADVLIVAWGVPHKSLAFHLAATLATMRASGKPLKCFGLTGGGHPRHPLYLRTETKLLDYPPLTP